MTSDPSSQAQQRSTTVTAATGGDGSHESTITTGNNIPNHSNHNNSNAPNSNTSGNTTATNNNIITTTTTTTTTTLHGGSTIPSSSSKAWATVSWMPHASLSQTSHVAISVRAALAKLGGDYHDGIGTFPNPGGAKDFWQVQVTVRGLAGLPLVPVASKTRPAPLELLHSEDIDEEGLSDGPPENDNDEGFATTIAKPPSSYCHHPLVHESTHVCRWDKTSAESADGSSSQKTLLPIPLRWRDLPRDAYLEFSLTGSRGDTALYEPTTLSFFDDYGKLRSGLNKLPLVKKKRNHDDHRRRRRNHKNTHATNNPGLAAETTPVPSSPWQDRDDDPVWKASKILEQLDRFDDQQSGNNSGTGQQLRGNSHRAASRTTTTTTTTRRQPQQQQQQHLQRPLAARKPGSREGSPFWRGGNTTGNNSNNFGDIPSVPWLDRMARDYCEQTLREAKETSKHMVVWDDDDDDEAKESDIDIDAPSAYLLVEIPSFDVPVVHEESFYPNPRQGPSGSVTPLDLALYQQSRNEALQQNNNNSDETQLQQLEGSLESPLPFSSLAAVPFLDYENENDSPIDDKYRTLAHDLLRGLVDPALKPDRVQRNMLEAIIASPSHHPSREEKDLLWRFRFSLVDNRKALTKFLLAVDWTVEIEVVQAAELLEQWRKRSPIEVTDALKLLGKQVAYQTNLVRAYAIDTLASAPDEELHLYLLQLVQALKYENSLQQQQQQQQQQELEGDAAASSTTKQQQQQHQQQPPDKTKKSSLATFLIARASKNVLLANYLYWYLKVELQDPAHGARYREVFDEFKTVLSRAPYPRFLIKKDPRQTVEQQRQHQQHTRRKSNILSSSSMASSSASLVNKLGESVSKLVGDKLLGADNSNSSSTTADPHHHNQTSSKSSSNKKVRSVWDVLSDQDTFISGVMDVQMSYQSKAKQPAKEAHLRSVLAKEGYEAPPENDTGDGASNPPRRSSFPMPCAPEILVDGVFPEKAKVFKSAVYPALIEFHVDHVVDKNLFGNSNRHVATSKAKTSRSTSSKKQAGGRPPAARPSGSGASVPQMSSYRVLMKTGDDLRQDQLVMMMIKLMDRLLKRASLDLCITPYSIIATSQSSGMIEFVEESCPLSAVLANNNNSVLQFFQKVAPQKGSKHGIRPEVLSSYVRSVAGGCVLTYLLGVGDRHLDNLMITKTGRFFHIDFGFLFGRDPKPLPPAFRLTREMVEGMGGSESAEYRQFCSLACQAFNALRKSAGLVLNLLHLMSDAGIEDLSNNPSADADGVIAKVEERFRLDLTDEQAERFFLTLINDSLAALAPRLMDVFHSIAVARR